MGRCFTFVPTSTTGFFPTRSLTRGKKLPEASIRSTSSTAIALFSLTCSGKTTVLASYLNRPQAAALTTIG